MSVPSLKVLELQAAPLPLLPSSKGDRAACEPPAIGGAQTPCQSSPACAEPHYDSTGQNFNS